MQGSPGGGGGAQAGRALQRSPWAAGKGEVTATPRSGTVNQTAAR